MNRILLAAVMTTMLIGTASAEDDIAWFNYNAASGDSAALLTAAQPFLPHAGVDPAACDETDDYNRPLKASGVSLIVRTASGWCMHGYDELAIQPFNNFGGGADAASTDSSSDGK